MRTVYLDHNATTPPDPRASEAVHAAEAEAWANAGSGHRAGRAASRALHDARRRVAARLGVTPREIVFTSGATESDNLALRGVMTGMSGRRLVISAVEHPAVRDTALALEREAVCPVTEIGVDDQGRLDLEALDRALAGGDVGLVALMAANNETGVIFPVGEIAARVHAAGALLHVDAVQLVGRSPIDPASLGADLLALSAHKFHGPKGVGVLAVRRGVTLAPLAHGGGQEKGRRPGTVNAPGIVGLATALDLTLDEASAYLPATERRRDALERGLRARVGGLHVSGANAPRLANTTHLTLEGVEAEPLQIALDREGIAASVGSACSTGALEPSHVLRAMRVPPERLHGALRLSLGRGTTDADVDRVLEVLPAAVERLRALAGPPA